MDEKYGPDPLGGVPGAQILEGMQDFVRIPSKIKFGYVLLGFSHHIPPFSVFLAGSSK